MSMEAYRHPEYYDIAFAVADAAREVDFFEAAIRQFSRASVHRVFEIACGTAPYLAEWQRRGYRYCGLDLSPAMLDRARAKAAGLGIAADFLAGDMRDFARATVGPVDLAYVLLGSIYVGSNREFLAHLERVADVLAGQAQTLARVPPAEWYERAASFEKALCRARGSQRPRSNGHR